MRKLFQSKRDVCDIANCQKLPSSISTSSAVKHCHVVFWSHKHVPDSIKAKKQVLSRFIPILYYLLKGCFFHWKNTWNCMNFEIRCRRGDWTKVGKILFLIHFLRPQENIGSICKFYFLSQMQHPCGMGVNGTEMYIAVKFVISSSL